MPRAVVGTDSGSGGSDGIQTFAASVLRKLPEHELQNSAVAVIFELCRGVDTAGNGECLNFAVIASGLDDEILSQLQTRRNSHHFESLEAGEIVIRQVFTRLELQRHDAHADQVTAVNTFVALGNDGFYTE